MSGRRKSTGVKGETEVRAIQAHPPSVATPTPREGTAIRRKPEELPLDFMREGVLPPDAVEPVSPDQLLSGQPSAPSPTPEGWEGMRWVELSVHSAAKLGQRNLEPLWEAVYRTGETFDLVIINAPSNIWKERRTVRYFLGSTPQAIESVKTVANSIGVWALDCNPPVLDGVSLEFQFKDFFAYYLISPPEREQLMFKGGPPMREEVLPESLVLALSQGGWVWVRLRADPKAAGRIRMWGASSKGGGWFTDLGRGADILPRIDGAVEKEIKRREEERRRREKEERMNWAAMRASEPLFAVRMMIGGTPEDCRRIAAALPAPLKLGENSLAPFRTYRQGEVKRLPEPKSGTWKDTVRPLARWFSLLGPFLLLTRVFGIFPWSWSPPPTVPFALSILASALLFSFVSAFWRVWKPIVCSVREVASVFSFPIHLERAPLEFAPYPVEAEKFVPIEERTVRTPSTVQAGGGSR
jgi:hypothetical protein